MSAVAFRAAGKPEPQGSKNAFVVNGRAVIVDKNPKPLKAWRRVVSDAAIDAMVTAGDSDPLIGPVRVSLVFFIERPKSVKREHPSVRPDIDKLARAVLDGLTTAGVYSDDSQVVDLTASKVYGVPAGVAVQVSPLSDGNEEARS